jgi:tetratricopeptide (TPR) repeat protein
VALAEAAKARGWEERERLRKAAEKVHADRLSRIDELADSFAEIEGTPRSTEVFDEMRRILAEEGVDQALAYVAAQRAGILEKVKARAIATHEKNRADLLPLLKSAQLEAELNHPVEATRLFDEILAMEADWPDALDAQFWFLVTQGDHAFVHTTLAEAFGYFQTAEATAQHLLKVEAAAPRSWRDVSVVLNKLADFLASRRQPGDAEKALSHYQRSNELLEDLRRYSPQSGQAARDVSVSLERLGDFLASRGQPGDAEKALSYYQRSLKVREDLLRDNPQSGQAAREVSVGLNKLADFLAGRGQPDDAEKALNHYERSLEFSEDLLRDNPQSGQAARDVSVSLEMLGDFLASRGQPGDAERALSHYERSLKVREDLLRDDPQSGQAARGRLVGRGETG